MSAKHKTAKKHASSTHHEHKGAAHNKTHKTHTTQSHHGHKKAVPKKDTSNDTMKNAAIVVLVIALIAVLIWAVGNDNSTGSKKGSATGNTNIVAAGGQVMDEATLAAMTTLSDDDAFLGAADAPVVMVEFSDFECPFCERFWSDTLPAIKENFIDTGVVKFIYRDLPLSFHANAQKAAEASECAHAQGKYWEYHDKLFENQASLSVNSLKKYAADIGLDVAQFDDCLTSGMYAAEVNADAAAAAQNGISGTPGFIINGQKVSGAQPYDKFEQIICAMVPESEPCANMEPPVAVEVTILNDASCATCDASAIRATSLELFPGATFKTVDASSTEGKALIEKYDLVYAPSYIFSASVVDTKTWSTRADMAGFFTKLSDGMYQLKDSASGADWYLDEDAREAAMALLNEQLGLDLNDGKPQVDFFVMSYCPYGNQAEELLKPVFDELKGQAIFNPRYVIYGSGSGCYTDTDGTQLCSLHGEVELNQNIRELCVLDEYGEEAWFDFALAMNDECTGTNADTCWSGVAEDLGYDTATISSCFDENKITYAREQYELNRALGVSGSPTIFFEAQLYNGARSSNSYLAALCAGFDDAPAACNNVVAEVAPAVPVGSC